MPNLGSLPIKNTKDLLSPDTRLCLLIGAPSKYGKTELASQLDVLTQKYRGKPSLVIAFEAAEGGGTMSVATKGLEYVMPKDWSETENLIASLASDTKYGGIILDNATDWILRAVKPHALKFPTKEKTLGARSEGVPVRGDYQTMGECGRQQLNRLVNLTNETTRPEFRKDLVVTALLKEETDDNGNLECITVNLPGALSSVATAMFQSVVHIKIVPKVIKMPDGTTRRMASRQLISEDESGTRIVGDRTGIFTNGYSLTDEGGKPRGLVELYDTFVSRFARA